MDEEAEPEAVLSPDPQPALSPEPQPALSPEPQPALSPEPQPALSPEPQPALSPGTRQGLVPADLRPRLQRGVQWVAGRSLNRAAIGALRLGLPFWPYGTQDAMVIETFGRLSGKRRLTPVGCLREGGRILAVAEHGRSADWVRNSLAAREVRLWLAGRQYRGRVQILAGADPEDVLARMTLKMGNRMHAASVHVMAHDPCVVAIDLDE